jgi:cytochrome c oxidase assembly protein subunit 15
MKLQDRKQIGRWLLIGVFMIVIQTLLGGITRLTESGLSITEWNVVAGTLPPLNSDEWNIEFDKYKQSSQYHLLNEGMQLHDFKKIFWWEYVHRLWARLFLPVFLIPLFYFIATKKINRSTVIKSLIALVLGTMQGLVGWIMVASGLEDRAWVGPAELTMHFMLAMLLLCYMMWIALEVFAQPKENLSVTKLKPLIITITILLSIQLSYGSLMAGNHAALFYPTFPKFGERWIPAELFILKPFVANFFENIGMIQLIHRSLGLVIAALVFLFYFKARAMSSSLLFFRVVQWLPMLVILQVALGILTLLNSLGKIPIALAALHQMCAVLLLLAVVIALFLILTAEKKFSEQPVEVIPSTVS